MDDAVIPTHVAKELQLPMDYPSQALETFGFTNISDKTQVIMQHNGSPLDEVLHVIHDLHIQAVPFLSLLH